jgi:hypothetical protein
MLQRQLSHLKGRKLDHSKFKFLIFSVTGLINSLKLKLCYDRLSVDQSVLVSSPIRGPRLDLLSDIRILLTWAAISDERTGLLFTLAAGLIQYSHSWVRVPRDSGTYFIASDSKLPRIYIFQEQGGPVAPPGTWFSFCRLLRFAGLR